MRSTNLKYEELKAMDQRSQENRITDPESSVELKPEELEKVSGGGEPVPLPRNEEKGR